MVFWYITRKFDSSVEKRAFLGNGDCCYTLHEILDGYGKLKTSCGLREKVVA